jgi:beta-lactamase class A
MARTHKPLIVRSMPRLRFSRRLLIGSSLALLAGVMAVQLFYPYEIGLPLASIAGTSVRHKTSGEIAQVIAEKFDTTKVRLVLDGAISQEIALKSAGAEPNTERMIERVSGYPLWLRFIPGSIFWPSALTEADVYFTSTPFEEFVGTKAKELSFQPSNAHLAIKDGELVATEAIKGSEVDPKELVRVLSTSHILLGATTDVVVPAKRTDATRSLTDLASVKSEAEAILAHTISIKAGDKTFSPDKAQIASWIVLADDEKNDVTLAVDKEKVKTYLTDLNKMVGVPSGQTNITIVDGREVGRTTGASGRELAIDTLANQLVTALQASEKMAVLEASFKESSPSVIFNSRYTATQEGLQAYANDVARTKNVRIFIQQLTAPGWQVGAREWESIPSGSTYKLFVALVLFDRIDKGEIRWTDPMLDTTVAGCFERMTVASTNPCAESWIVQFGRQYINDFIHARGFSAGTSFTTGGANQTTAADLTKFMRGLNDGTLVGGANRDRLLDSLGRHPYGYGIPTGSKGSVRDKVGFLWDYVHDTAIVNHPRGTYLMTIMTKGQSYAVIASITREVERIMYP